MTQDNIFDDPTTIYDAEILGACVPLLEHCSAVSFVMLHCVHYIIIIQCWDYWGEPERAPH